MTHEELVKEADRISNSNKTEIWNCAFDLLRRKENEKLNRNKVYECQDTLSWYIDFNDGCDFAVYPFGFFFADYFNQLLSLKSKEAFISYEKRMRSGAKSAKEVNPLFDKRTRYYIWGCNEESPDLPMKLNLSDKELEELYNRISWLWKYNKNDTETLISNFRYLKSHTVSNDTIYRIYFYVHKMVLLNWFRQRSSSLYDKNNKFYNADDENGIEEEHTELVDYDFITRRIASQFRYMGYTPITLTDNTETLCKKYDVPNLLLLVAEDLMHFLLHQTTHNFEVCSECGCMFVTTHGNQKHCPACKEIIRQKQRKSCPPRYLHKKITDFINNNSDEENPSESFRNESNYYWAIIQGKTPKLQKESWYHSNIKTETDYMNWLECKKAELKKTYGKK